MMATASLDSAHFEATDLTPLIGTEIRADLEGLLSGRYAQEIRALLEHRGVLAIRGLNLDDDQQQRLTATLGEPLKQAGSAVINVSLDKRVNQEKADYQRANEYWHIDMMSAEVPNLASIMSARVLSPTGGETEFANTYAAWDELPDDEKNAYEGLKVMHALEASQYKLYAEPTTAQIEQWRQVPSRVHPLVWSHRSGRKSLVLGATAFYILGKSPEESAWILARLLHWSTQSRFVYQHKWTLGDLIIWDNTGTLHRVQPYAIDSGRLMRRTAIQGEEQLV